ncbi:MAG TPA: ssDNA-binding protein, partial [Ramlibacter sp.]|uniref:ssDNA-binding protein n=1 Tax=Ramlibacter sp. TaxID=1917967 RepID=UPI002B7F4C5D
TGELYAGLIVRASVRPYYYPQQGGGIAFGLGNIQVLRDGPRLDNRLAAEDEFEADANAAAAASNADLTDIL